MQKPKARDRGATTGARIRFTSNILPKWARRTKSLDALLPVLYLRGISAGDFQEALTALLGKDAPNLSPAVIARLSKDLNGVITGWNSGAQRLFGYTAEEAVGRSVTLIIPTDRHDEEPMIFERGAMRETG